MFCEKCMSHSMVEKGSGGWSCGICGHDVKYSRLTVTYDLPLEEELDSRIIELALDMGYSFYASGSDLRDTRELIFERR